MSYVRCINNRGYEASLTEGLIYKVLPDNTDQVSYRVIETKVKIIFMTKVVLNESIIQLHMAWQQMQ